MRYWPLIFLLFSIAGWAACPSGTPSRTVAQSGGDHQSLDEALNAAVPGDVICIQGFWTEDDPGGNTFVRDDNITIETDTDDARHNGYYLESDNHWRLDSDASEHLITVNNPGTVFDGLALVQRNTQSNSREGIRLDVAGTYTVKNSIIWASVNRSDQDGIYVGSRDVTVTVENTMLYGFARGGIHGQASSTATQVWNINSVTAWNNGRGSNEPEGGGFSGTATGSGVSITLNIHNSISVENDSTASDDYNETASGGGTVTWDIHNSMDSDNSITSRDGGAFEPLPNRTAVGSTGCNAANQVCFEDIAASPYDLRLFDDCTNNDAQDAHNSDSGAGLDIPGTDIVGTTRNASSCSERPADNHDLGAFEIEGAVVIGPSLRILRRRER